MLNIQVPLPIKNKKLHLPKNSPTTWLKRKQRLIKSRLTQELLDVASITHIHDSYFKIY